MAGSSCSPDSPPTAARSLYGERADTCAGSRAPASRGGIAAYLSLASVPGFAGAPVLAEPGPEPEREPQPGWRARIRPAALSRSFATAGARSVLSASAICVIILGAAPMAAAQASPGAPVCTTDCPLVAQEFRQAGVLLGADDSKVELVAVNLNPLYASIAYTQAFDREQQLSGVRDWLYLTGSPAQLRPVWRQYGVASQTLPAGSMLLHSDTAFVIGPSGQLRLELNFDPGPGTAATESSFATELATAARQALGSR